MMKKLTIIITCIVLAGGLCSCADKYDDSALWDEIEKINSRIDAINDDISALQLLVGAVQTGKQVVEVVDTGEGYKIIFSDGSNIVLTHGQSGADAPIVGVKEEGGVYYWTITTDGKTDFITDSNGDPLPVTGADGATPVIAVDAENYWTIDGKRIPDGNDGWVKASGEDGDSFLQDIEETPTEVIITLADGEVIKLQKFIGVTFAFDRTMLVLGYGQSANVAVTQSGVQYTSISKPDGWRVKLYDDYMLVTAPARPNAYAEQSGTVSVVAVGATTTVVASVEVSADSNLSGGGAGESEWHQW